MHDKHCYSSGFNAGRYILVLFIAMAAFFCPAQEAAPAEGPFPDLTRLSLAELMEIPITTVSRAPARLSGAAAAVTVITDEDIRRSGVNSIPDALRLVPGLQVAQVDAHTWAISSRGFNDVFANKLLVMMDGRTIYTPLFSGVFWDVQDTMLEDIERIEVVRGPGASLWGANAVNGVINIITKSARDTQGWLITGGGGTEERGFGGVRYGASVNPNTHLRVYAKYLNRDHSVYPDGTRAFDAWEMFRGGFRMDIEPGVENLFTFQADVYDAELRQLYFVPVNRGVRSRDSANGGNLLGRWTHTFSERSELALQVYYDHTERRTAIFEEARETGDIDFQHKISLGERHRFIWGAGYRRTRDEVVNTEVVALDPHRRSLDLFSAFIQDEIVLLPERWRLTLGTKLEHNDFTGFEVQPGARLLWTPADRHAIWASVARAVRTPSRAEADIRLNSPEAPPGFATIFGSGAFESEELVAYEIGYRVQPHNRLTVDWAAFYNVYDKLRSLQPVGVFAQHLIGNELEGETYGLEVAAGFQASEMWRLRGGYSFLRMQLRGPFSPAPTSSELAEGFSPHHQAFVHSTLDLTRNVEFDTVLRYVDRLPTPAIPGYVTLDLRLAWKPSANWELSVVGRNLLDDRQPEFVPTSIATPRAEVERSVFIKSTWRF